MSKKYRIIAIAVCISMLYCFIASSSAIGTTQIFTGKIICEDNIDLSDIEIKLYSSAPTYDEEGNLLYYAETYEKSIYADTDGDFEFVKPSAYCSYTINIETLPVNYGITKHTQFIVPTRLTDSITIKPIATANTGLNGDSINVHFESSDGTVLYTAYEIIPDGTDTASEGMLQSMSTSQMITSYEALKDIKAYTYSGTIVTNGNNYRYSEPFDISGFSEIEKIDFLYSVGSISEDERNNVFSQFTDETVSQSCVHIISDDIETTGAKDGEIQGYQDPASDDHKTIIIGNYVIEVYYTASFLKNYQNELYDFYTDVEDVYTYFCETNGFLKPTGAENSVLKIFITSEISDYGGTFANTDGGSVIWIKESRVASGKGCETIAHEFMHAIMHKYLIFEESAWFEESFAEFASFIFMYDCRYDDLNTDYGFWDFRQGLEDYIYYCYMSLWIGTPELFEYGAFVYPLYIYENLGGWNTIKNIYSNYSTSLSEFANLSGTYGGVTFNYKTIFAKTSKMLIKPNNEFTSLSRIDDLNGDEINAACYIQENLQSFSSFAAPMAVKHYEYIGSLPSKTLYITIEATDESKVISAMIGKRSNTESKISGYQTIYDLNRIVYSVDDFGSYGSQNVVIAPLNLYTTGNAISYSISLST